MGEMLNSDISDTETQPQPDIERASLSSASSQVSVDIKCEPREAVSESLALSPPCEGLLKIASPVKYSSSESSPAGVDHVTRPPPPPSSPGPPVLEPMTTTTTKPGSPVTVQVSAYAPG